MTTKKINALIKYPTLVDTPASALALENKLPFRVFDLNEDNGIVKALSGEFSGTKVLA